MRRVLSVAVALLFLSGCCSLRSTRGAGAQGNPEDSVPGAEAGFELQDVHFSFDSSVIEGVNKDILGRNAQWLKNNPSVAVTVEGNCDERGTAEYNLALGERRARSAYDFLSSAGVSADRMSTISYGEEQPLDPAHNESAWSQNRRVHLRRK